MTETDTPASDIGTATGLYRTGQPIADTKAPPGPIGDRWNRRKFEAKLVNPANRRKLSVIIVGTGLAGASAGATLAEAGYQVTSFCYQDSPRRAHSIAAQGGINAAKNYKADGDSVYRLFYDTVKGGDFRSRESNVYRLAEVSANVIVRDMVTGEIETHLADAVVLASGGYGNVYYLSTNAMGCNVTATWRAHRKGAYFGNPCFT